MELFAYGIGINDETIVANITCLMNMSVMTNIKESYSKSFLSYLHMTFQAIGITVGVFVLVSLIIFSILLHRRLRRKRDKGFTSAIQPEIPMLQLDEIEVRKSFRMLTDLVLEKKIGSGK